VLSCESVEGRQNQELTWKWISTGEPAEAGFQTGNTCRDPDLGPDFCIDQEKEMSRLGCVSVAAGVTLNLRCHSYNFQFFLQM
jgi:hypothetical protein